MRKVVATLLSSLALVFGLAGAATAAELSCSITNTGPNSNNTCEVKEVNKLEIKCKNNVDVVFVNGQTANSGSVTVSSNTNGGYAVSGNASNFNTTEADLDVSCAPAQQAVTPPAPAPTPPPAGGQGQGAAVQGAVTAAPAPRVKALPETGDNTLVSFVASSVAALVGVAIAGYTGLSLYRRAALK